MSKFGCSLSAITLQDRLAENFLFGIAEELARGVVDALDRAVRRGDEHRVVHAVQHDVEIVLGDRRLAQLLAHALERFLQLAELVLAQHAERARVVALADAIGVPDERRYRLLDTPRHEPGDHEAREDEYEAGEERREAQGSIGFAVRVRFSCCFRLASVCASLRAAQFQRDATEPGVRLARVVGRRVHDRGDFERRGAGAASDSAARESDCANTTVPVTSVTSTDSTSALVEEARRHGAGRSADRVRRGAPRHARRTRAPPAPRV